MHVRLPDEQVRFPELYAKLDTTLYSREESYVWKRTVHLIKLPEAADREGRKTG